MILFLAFLISISYVLTYLFIRLGKKKLIAVPNERSLHVVPTPKGGGIAIVITWYLGISVLYFSGIIEKNLFLALLTGVFIAGVSFLDDIFGIKPIIRLIIHFAAAITAFYLLGGLRPLILPELHFNYNFIVYPIAIIGMVWFINLFNFMDGVDGFASIEAITISLVLFFLSGQIINAVLISGIAGFLFWNWPKAKVFMGDVGSTQLGFVLVVLGIYYHNTYEFSILNWIMLTSPFWFDATLTLYRRWRNNEKLNVAHKKHIYQRLVQSGFSHLQVDFVLIIVNIVVLLMILVYREFKILQIPLFVLTISIFYILTRIVDKKRPF